MRKYVFLTLTIMVAVAIFLFSSQSKTDSRTLSDHVASVLSTQLTQVETNKSGFFVQLINQLFEEHIRKSAHICLYAQLGFLLYCTFYSYCIQHAYGWAIASGVFFGSTDELHQLFTKTRDARLRDVAIDAIGVVIGVAVAAGLIFLFHKYKRHRKRRHVTYD